MFFEQQRLVLCGGAPVRDRGQRLDVELDGIERVLREREAVGHDDRDRLADVTDLLMRDDRLLEGHELRQRREPQRNRGNRTVRRLRDVLGGEDAADAGQGARPGNGD